MLLCHNILVKEAVIKNVAVNDVAISAGRKIATFRRVEVYVNVLYSVYIIKYNIC